MSNLICGGIGAAGPFVRIRMMLRAGIEAVKRRKRPIKAQLESSIVQNPGMPGGPANAPLARLYANSILDRA
jgi:hypothetical protein